MKSRYLYYIVLFPILQSCFGTKSNTDTGMAEFRLVSKKTFSPEVIEKLKNTTTVFIYGYESGKSLDSLKEAIESTWDLTSIIFEPIERYGKYVGEPGYSCFIIEGGVSGATYKTVGGPNNGHTFSVTGTHIYLALRPYNEYGLCRIELYPDSKTLLSRDYDNFENTIPYKKSHFYNWSPVYLKAHLGRVSSNLKNNYVRPDLFEEYKHPNLSDLLGKDTLYVSRELLIKFNPFSGKEKSSDEEVFKKYKFPYKICTNSELYEIFVTQKRGRFLFEYVKSSNFKFLKIFDLKNKDIVYATHNNGYNLKADDMTKIK